MKNKKINLRVIIWNSGKVYRAISLDTNHSFEGDNIFQLRKKIEDGLLSYFDCFTKEELEKGVFYRPAPLKYRVEWFFIALKAKVNNSSLAKLNYNPQTHNLKFA